MKKTLSLAVLTFLLGTLAPAASAFTVFMIGNDDNPNATTELEQEGAPRTDQKYYWENGDYRLVTGRTGVGSLWSTGMEPWRDDTSILGFSRAVTSSSSSHDIFFQITPEMIASSNLFRLEIEYFGAGQAADAPASSHNIDYYMNSVKIGDLQGLSATNLKKLDLYFDASQFSVGPSVLSWTRTGGVAGYVNMDFVRLSVVPEPSILALSCVGLGLGLLHRRRV